MALMSAQLFGHPGIFHALIVPLSGLYPTGIPVFELTQRWEGQFLLHRFPLCPEPTVVKLHIIMCICISQTLCLCLCQINFLIFIHIIKILVSKLRAHQMRYTDYKFRWVLFYNKRFYGLSHITLSTYSALSSLCLSSPPFSGWLSRP